MKPNDKQEIDRLQEELNELRSDVSRCVILHTAKAMEELRRSVEDKNQSEEMRRNLDDLLASESIRDLGVYCFHEDSDRTPIGHPSLL